ncbi:MAG: hypothetical protein K8W52_21550 [Deltaproteobacteria bacterium]|nr:hypothetical protein [Deltaproteobacteria bacterium]
MRRKDAAAWIIAAVTTATLTGVATAQPAPPEPEPAAPPDAPAAPAGVVDPYDASGTPPAAGGVNDASAPPPVPVAPPAPVVAPPPTPRTPPLHVEMPQVISAPSARLLPAGVLYSRSGLDTSGGLSTDWRIGLGDVAEFGLAVSDLIRQRHAPGDAPTRIDGYANAIFKMGIAEDRLFRGQPAIALGFRKSFERAPDAWATRVAELHLVASKRLGSKASVHLGGVFWDAAIKHDGAQVLALHDRSVADQLRAFGGLELEPLPDAKILVDLYWSPEFCFGCVDAERIQLRPLLSWGVRYTVTHWMKLESGVRVPDIASANLLDAQIFGQLVLTDTHLHRAVGGH